MLVTLIIHLQSLNFMYILYKRFNELFNNLYSNFFHFIAPTIGHSEKKLQTLFIWPLFVSIVIDLLLWLDLAVQLTLAFTTERCRQRLRLKGKLRGGCNFLLLKQNTKSLNFLGLPPPHFFFTYLSPQWSQPLMQKPKQHISGQTNN